ncbi:hypothetical protein BN1708_013056 [Verticillium longisporum]|nr:Catabolic L-serine/threonine dehydratase like protein [Verticillium longisporum]CRK21268.1 hypothetical protein BN1708_013056 [Verticillium longisporum]
MGSTTTNTSLPWMETPLIPSPHLSRAAGCNIYLKLENLQPSGSFKSRGIGNLMLQEIASRPDGQNLHFYSSSGGNAGLACATSAHALNRPATIVTPTSSSPLIVSKLRLLGAEVEQVGANWALADKHLRENLVAGRDDAVYVPPFDHPHVWDGASTIVDELVRQAPGAIHGIACSVGGGGLLNGLFQGIEKHEAVRASSNPPWPEARRPSVLAVETRGADSLNASVEAAEHVTLPGITSIAKCLGAVRVSSKTWEWAQRKARLGPSEVTNATADGPAELESVAVEDSEAALACVQFADDTRFVVEVACGATIAACYNGLLRQRLGRGLTDKEWRHKNIVVIVCGGSDVSLEVLEGYKRDYGSAA